MLCEPGSSICMGSGKDAAMRRCADDGLSLLKPEQGDWCISSACTPDHTACAPVCTNGERKCDGVTIMVCENENWVESDSCDRSHVCNDEVGSICIPIRKTSGVGVCKEGETFCIDNRVMVCNNGLYEEQTACNNATESCITAYNTESNTYAAECSKTCVEKYCVENSLYYCVNGSAVGSSCKSADRCMLSPAQGKTGLEATCATKVCDEGTFSCAKSGKPELSILTICHNNAWIPLADCSEYNLSCSANGKIGKCI